LVVQMTRRRWWLAGVALVLLVLRVVLPEVVRRVAESQASERLRARVRIGDVDLALLRGAVALEDVAVRPAALPEGVVMRDDGTVDPETDPPVVSWQRFAVNLRWLWLPWKTVQFSSVELRDPRVAVDRLADGALNLMAFLPVAVGTDAAPPPEEPAAAAGPEEKATPWGVAADRVALVGGHLRFRDFAVKGDAEPVDIGLPTIVVRDVALLPGHYGGLPARTSLDVRVDEGRLRVNTRLWLREGGAALATTLRARRMPLRRVRFYVPDVGWNEVRGELGASLVHRLSTGERNVVLGTVTLDDVAVRVPDVEEPALTWKHLGIGLDRIDLQNHRADVAEVDLTGMTMALVKRGAVLLAVLSRGNEGETAAAAQTPPPPPPADAPPADLPPAASEPWRWSLARLRVGDSRIRLITDEGLRDVGVEVEASALAGDGDQVAPVKVGLTMDAARVGVEGGARIAQPGFDGTLTVSELPIPDTERLAGVLPPELLQKGVLGADLKVALGSAAQPAGDVVVSGKVTLRDFAMQGKDPKEFAVAVAGTDVDIGELRVPRVLVPDAEPAAPGPVTVRLTSLTVTEPQVQLTREKNGLVLPPFTRAAADASPATPPPAGAPPPKPPAASAAASGATAAEPVDVMVESMKVVKGQVRVTDRTVKPFFAGGLSPLDVDVRTLRWPAGTMERMRLEATSLTRGRLTVTGRMTAAGGNVEVNGKDIALLPFNPYATHYSPYSITGGALSVDTKATFGKGKYDSTTALALDGFDLGGKEGDSLFKEQFGVPLEVALALLRDIAGRIAFDIPVTGDEKGARVPLGTLVGQALRKALVGALASPLKLIGAAFGGAGGQTAPTPIAFRAGTAEPTDEGEKHIGALGELLASRPGIGITLKGSATEGDTRRLHEQALYEELARPQGVFGAIGNLAQRGARERIRLALAARSEGKEGALAAEDERKLDEWLAERPEPTKRQLAALVKARLDAVSAKLREGRGIGPERVRTTDPGGEVRAGDPTIEFDLGAAAAAR
jgi:hypothetical protein